MRFLLVVKTKYPLPAEAAPGLMDAMMGWASKYTGNGKIEQVWGFAGLPAGGGILNVASLEELDAIMTDYPLALFSDTDIFPLVDLQDTLKRAKQAMQAMAAGGGG